LFEKFYDLFLLDLPLSTGYIETFSVLIEDNQTLCAKITETDLIFFVKMIMTKGRKAELLKIFHTLLKTSYKNSIAKDVQTKILKILFEKTFFVFLAVIFKIYKFLILNA